MVAARDPAAEREEYRTVDGRQVPVAEPDERVEPAEPGLVVGSEPALIVGLVIPEGDV